MKQIASLALTVLLVAAPSLPALAEAALPEGASIAKDAKALLTYTPKANPGTADFDATDRLAIANQIYAYSFAYDNYESEAWFDLFTSDAVFVAGVPGEQAISFSGDGFRTFWTERMKEFSSSGNQRRHLMTNILFLGQTADTAHVSVTGLLTNATNGKTFAAVSSLNYEGWLVKGSDGWKIQRWHDFPDSVVPE
ncbi:nuclear transport factor 2 family protein [Tropicimonas sp. IMCC34043]|uniref:nuclear transport factor 2 family protein n=1 Tax=Tropicimonas sp. IMCC34043 TaxID=2248760 RepID=UPI000E267CE1|nr:nuclear transport factor 2 family protein [Tropicimonas sp. IMCC34043]